MSTKIFFEQRITRHIFFYFIFPLTINEYGNKTKLLRFILRGGSDIFRLCEQTKTGLYPKIDSIP